MTTEPAGAAAAIGTTIGERIPATPKGRDARRRLLDAGRAVFGSAGYAGARVVDVTEAAGLSQGAFYRYFQDRRDLLLVLLQEMLDEAFREARAPWDSDHPFESVRITTERYFAFYDRNRALMGTMIEMVQTDPHVRQLWIASRAAFYRRTERMLRRGMESGTVRADVDPGLAAELMGSMTEFYAFQRYALLVEDLSPADPAAVAATLTEIWIGGLGSSGSDG